MSETQTHYRTCNICEAMCGLAIEHRGQEILSIKADKEDPFSRGHICPKAVALQDYYHDPDRLKTPIIKTANGWQDISWSEAFALIADKIRGIQTQFGPDAVGVYLGNPNAHNFGNALTLPTFFKSLGSNSRFSSASADQLPHHVAANYMFGAGLAISVPDINRTDYFLVIGGNPVVSNGSMMTSAGIPSRLKDIKARNGKIVVIDPRRTETAKIATEHHFIRPEKDALFLMALIQTVCAERNINLRHLENHVHGLETILKTCEAFSPERVSGQVGMSAETIRKIAQEFANAPSAVCYSRMGASTQSYGGLCQWLTVVLNIITGNFDREGGAMFPLPAFDLLQRVKPGRKSNYGRFESRVRKLPFFNSEFPVATMADEIETEGDGQIKAMFTIAGNPVMSAPNGDRLDAAFESLDFMVSVDIYLNETTRHADIILPATTGLEVPHYDVFFNSFAVSNTAKYSPPMFEKTEQQKHDWEILRELANALNGVEDTSPTPEETLDMGLQHGAYKSKKLSLDFLKTNPHGVDLGPLQPCFENRIKTEDGFIDLAPEIFVNDVARLHELINAPESKHEYPFDLISRRLVRNHNTWTHNSYRLIKGKNPVTLQMHSQDAERLGFEAGQSVAVVSQTGRVELPVEFCDDMMPGVVSMPQGWGHQTKDTNMSVAAQQPGVSMNSLTDDQRVDPLTGNAAFNGTPVRVQAAV